jgi:hypothetical protein
MPRAKDPASGTAATMRSRVVTRLMPPTPVQFQDVCESDDDATLPAPGLRPPPAGAMGHQAHPDRPRRSAEGRWRHGPGRLAVPDRAAHVRRSPLFAEMVQTGTIPQSGDRWCSMKAKGVPNTSAASPGGTASTSGRGSQRPGRSGPGSRRDTATHPSNTDHSCFTKAIKRTEGPVAPHSQSPSAS